MWINNRILLSGVTATLLLASCPTAASAAEIGPIYEDGTFDITVAVGDTITLDDNSGTLNAIELYPFIDTGVSILNEGVITIDSIIGSDATGIYSFDNYGYVNNSGTIDVSTNDVYATGIYIVWNESDGTITNESTGTISANSIDGGADGIYIIENYGVVENYGSINAISENANAVGIHTEWNATDVTDATITNKSTGIISATSTNGDASGIVALENYSIIENYGSIDAISENGNAVGIYTEWNESDITVATITNKSTGTISATSTNGGASGIVALENYSVIENYGSINAISGNGNAVGIYVDYNDPAGIITNAGSIIAEGLSDTYGIYSNTNDGTITHSGTIEASTTDYGAVYGIYTLSNYGTITADGSIYTHSLNGSTYGIYSDGDNGNVINANDSIIATSTNGDATGIHIGGNNQNLTNNGSIEAQSVNNRATGIEVSGSNDVVISNMGSITSNSINNDAYGIAVGSNAGTISNAGSIIAEGLSDTYGIYSNTNDGTITHSGTIEASTTDDGTAYGIYMSNNYGTVTVDGSINAHSVNGSTVGIYAGNNQDGANITNNGAINVDSENGSATGIDISGSNDGTITNNSIINADSVFNDAYGIRAGSSFSPETIANDGDIEVGTTDANAYGIYVDNATDSVITNSGSIVVNSTNNDAYGIYSNDFTNAALSNSGTITAPIALYLTNSGTVENTSSGVINGDIQAGMSNFQNNGTINLASTATSAVNDFTQSPTGVLSIKLNSGADGIAEYSKLSANGAVTLNSGTTLNVNVQTSTDYQNLLIGQQLADVISATTLTADASALNITDTSALLNFVPVIDGTTLDLDVVQGTSIEEATQNSRVFGAYGAANVLEEYAGDDLDLNAFISSLNTLETEEEVAHAILETTPTTTTALSNMNTQFYNNIGSIVGSHQNNPRGMNSGDMVLGDKNLWIKPFGSYSKQNNKDGFNGFSAHSKGVGIGFDGEYENNQRIGLAVFYTQADADTNGVNQNTKLDIFNLIVYGNFPIIDNSTNLFYQLGMGIQQTNSTRTITAPALTAKADFNAKTLFANIKLARDTALNSTLNLSNQLFGTYVYYKNPSYSESGAGGLNLNVQGFNTTSLVFGVEESLKYSMIEGTNLILNLALGYDFGDTKQDVMASYYGASGTVFTTSGIDNGPWSYKTGVEIAQELQNNLSVSVGYDLDGKGSDFKNHSVSAKVNWKF